MSVLLEIASKKEKKAESCSFQGTEQGGQIGCDKAKKLSPHEAAKEVHGDFFSPSSVTFKVSFQISSFVIVPIYYFGALLSDVSNPAAGSSVTEGAEGVPLRDIARVWCLVFKAFLSLGLAFPASLSLTPCLQG